MNPPFHVMVKPVGPACNLACAYCYYLPKRELLGRQGDGRLSDELLERFTRQYIEAQPAGAEINFAWQGGEPLLAGLDFFRRAVELQERFAPPGAHVTNSLQTNGTLIDDAWAEFFANHGFLIGLSLDGPAQLHDAYRLDHAGRASFDRTMAGLEKLRKHNVDFNALVVVNRRNARRPVDVYRFLRDRAGIQFIQFIPCVERTDFAAVAPQRWPGETMPMLGEPAARPGDGGAPRPDEPVGRRLRDSVVADWSVDPDDYGAFLCGVFDEWLTRDVGRVFVQAFDVALGLWMGLGSSLCVFARTCGNALAMECDGGVYACDHYVYPEYRLGNIAQTPLAEMVGSDGQGRFGRDKTDALPQYCRQCEWLFACNGECPKNRFLRAPDGQPGLNYLCPALKRFFAHIDPWMKRMAAEVRSGRPAVSVMHLARQGELTRVLSDAREYRPAPAVRSRPAVGPNAPCPCGSGKKFKRCCGGSKGIGNRE